MILCRSGKFQAYIAADCSAHPVFRTAAAGLADYLEKICGDRPQVTDAAEQVHEREIVLALNGRKVREDMPETGELKNDGFRIVTRGERLFIISGSGRGILFGVYRFLERFLGCGFYSAKVEKVPKRSEIVLEDIDFTLIPPFAYREIWWYEYETDPAFAKKRGVNSSVETDMGEGGFDPIRYNGHSHTLFDYISPGEFFDEHPEYFSMVDGKRLREKPQLCLTNPDVLRIFRKRLREKLQAAPEKKIVSVTQMDWRNYCTCPACRKVYEEEGALSGTFIRFVNELARDIRDDYPDVTLDTFAYQYTRIPPRVTKPEPNVCVRICTIECCFKHSYSECDEITKRFSGDYPRRTLREDLADWAEICSNIYVWDYSTNFRYYLAPFPNLQVLQPNFRYLIDHHAVGLFEQGNAQAASGEFGELRGYLVSRLMWEPDLDVPAARDEFLQTYYGNAWEAIRDYLVTLERKTLEKQGHLGIYMTPEEYLPEDFAAFADPLFDKAEELAENEDVLFRVRKSRLSVRFIKLRALAFDDPERDRLLTEFKNDMIRFGVGLAREGRGYDGRDNSPEHYVETWRKTRPEDMPEFDKNKKYLTSEFLESGRKN